MVKQPTSQPQSLDLKAENPSSGEPISRLVATFTTERLLFACLLRTYCFTGALCPLQQVAQIGKGFIRQGCKRRVRMIYGALVS